MKKADLKQLSLAQQEELLDKLKVRFEKNMKRHKNLTGQVF